MKYSYFMSYWVSIMHFQVLQDGFNIFMGWIWTHGRSLWNSHLLDWLIIILVINIVYEHTVYQTISSSTSISSGKLTVPGKSEDIPPAHTEHDLLSEVGPPVGSAVHHTRSAQCGRDIQFDPATTWSLSRHHTGTDLRPRMWIRKQGRGLRGIQHQLRAYNCSARPRCRWWTRRTRLWALAGCPV